MTFSGENKNKTISDYRQHDTDTGSVEVQVALLTDRISELSEHMKRNPKDNHSKRGMMRVINNRKSLLKYLNRKNHDRYTALIERLGLRK